MIRTVLGIVAGLVLVASSAAHSLLGWPQLRARLVGTNAPADLITGLAIGWHFAGVSMLAFGVIVLWTFVAWRGRLVSLVPARVIGLLYVAFGAAALAVSGTDPFFLLVFVVPGLMLLAAAWGRDADAGR